MHLRIWFVGMLTALSTLQASAQFSVCMRNTTNGEFFQRHNITSFDEFRGHTAYLGLCKNLGCGNGIVENGEACDEGGYNGHGCTSDCRVSDYCDTASNAALYGLAAGLGSSIATLVVLIFIECKERRFH